jgi:WD40 repeat protein
MDWSPDGGTLAVASGVELTLLSGDAENVLAVLKPSSGALTAAWSPDGKQFATVVGLRNPRITIWDWNAASSQIAQSKQILAGADQYGVSRSPDGRYLASLADDRRSIIQIWDTATWALLNKFELPYANPRRALIWSSDSQTLHDAGELGGEAVCFALNVENGDVRELRRFPAEQVYAFTISPDSKKVAAADEGGIVRIYEVASGLLLHVFQSVDTPVDLAWDPTGRILAVLGYKTGLQLWEFPE